MKKITLMMICLLGLREVGFGQDEDGWGKVSPTVPNSKKTNLEQNESAEKILNSIQQIQKSIQELKDEKSEKVGELTLKKIEDIKVYDGSTNSGKLTITNVRVCIKDGYVVNIEVLGKDENDDEIKFTNARAPIPLLSERMSQDILAISTGGSLYIKVGDFFDMNAMKRYVGKDEYFVLDDANRTHTFYKDVSLNSVFDIRLFSDALGVFGGKDNGLVQLEFVSKTIIHRKNYFNTGIFYPFQRFKFRINASKFDSKLAYTPLDSSFNRTSLYQKSWLSTEVSTSLGNWWLEKKSLHNMSIEVGAGINLSNVAKKKDTLSATSIYFFLEPCIELHPSDNVGIDIYARFSWHQTPQIDGLSEIHKGTRYVFSPSVSIFWNPSGNEAGRIFGRARYTTEFEDRQKGFFQLQVGYTLLLSQLAKNGK
jgi:hypothetical protein